MNLETDIVVTCHCGALMDPVISAPNEILYICPNESCPGQVNVSTTTKIRSLETPDPTHPSDCLGDCCICSCGARKHPDKCKRRSHNSDQAR